MALVEFLSKSKAVKVGRYTNAIFWISALGVVLVAYLSTSHYLRERPTRVLVEGEGTPVFVLSGSGDLSTFSVYAVSSSDFEVGRTVRGLDDDSFFAAPPVWRIAPYPGPMHGRRVEDIGNLAYGVVPSGYKQEIPAVGTPPQPIIPDKKYYFQCLTTNAPPASGGFQVSGGKAVPVALALPCLQKKGEKEVTVPCPASVD